MEITENTFIDILGLPEWDDSVLEVLKAPELERPIVEEGELYAYLSSEKYGVNMVFGYDCIMPLQKKLEADRNLYVEQISFNSNTSLLLPYHLKMIDSYEEVVAEVGKKTDAKSLGSNTRFRWIIDDKKNKFRFIVNFRDEDLQSLNECTIKIEP